jgi:hypothetical protein
MLAGGLAFDGRLPERPVGDFVRFLTPALVASWL